MTMAYIIAGSVCVVGFLVVVNSYACCSVKHGLTSKPRKLPTIRTKEKRLNLVSLPAIRYKSERPYGGFRVQLECNFLSASILSCDKSWDNLTSYMITIVSMQCMWKIRAIANLIIASNYFSRRLEYSI